MTTAEFIAHLRTLDIRVSVDGERLRCSAPKGMLTDGLREELAARKAEILAWLPANVDGHDITARAPAADGYHEPLSVAQQRLGVMHPLQPGGVAYHIAGGIRAQGSGPARIPREGDLPLSFAQQRLWFLDQLEPGTSAYTIAARRRLHGPLDFPALASACTALVRRHETLRTTFTSKDGEPVQRVADPEPVTLGIVDLERHAAADRDRVAWQIVREEAQRPFDLARGPLFRPVLLRLEPDEHELLVSVHHIVADGWSLGILARELDALYEASVAGRPSPLPELPIQYADFALWQRRWLTGEVLETQRQYWRKQLGGRPAPLELPTDHPRSSRPTCAGASHDFTLPHPLADRLRELSRRERATPFMTLLAGFKALLARYTGQEDIVVGTAVANRHYVELEPVIGLFANTLVLRTDLAGDPTCRELLARVRETCLDAYAHPDMPFEKLVEELQPERVLGQNPLFQASFVWQDAATGADLAFVTVASPFDLTLFVCAGTDGTLSATIQYKRDLFEPETIARLVGHYCTLLEGVAADPDRRLSALALLSDAEAHQLLIEWNATNVPGAAEETVPRLIEAQAAQTPEAIAVSFEGQPINYRELNRRANRLAHHLRRLGVGPSVLVGVFVERSAEMLIAVLAVMKAGGAYVPLDPAYPADGLEFMLQDARVPVLVTQEGLLDRLALPAELRAVCVDRDARHIDAERESDLEGGPGADDLAYVIYTSGSTGWPKGVQIAHRSLTNLLAAFRATPGITASDVFVSVTTLSFDIAGLELFLPLVTGAHLVIASREVAADPARLMALMAEAKGTVMQATPTTWCMLLEAGWGNAAGLTILCGGEALPSELAARLLGTGASVWNVYGPTETTIWSTIHRVDAADDPVPIGRSIANTRVYVLDRHLRPVPIGVPGELWIAGDGLARGYGNRPQLTAERFVMHRLSETLEERLYRSGDLVRWRGNGTLEFLGRLDDQVKVRGYRVELGEIEATLARHPHVREAAAVARRTTDGERRLVAYVVGNGPVDAHDLREFLGSKLPDYMIPAAFVALDRLPLTANGKVDRQALPEPEASAGTVDSSAEPCDELERQLVKLWQDVLSVGPVGIRDNFFDLGGHSLLAVRMFAQLQEQLRVTLPLATLFRAPTIAGLAALIRGGARPALRRSLIPIQPAGSRPPVFGIPGVGGTVLVYNALARLLGPDQPFYGLQSRGLDGLEEPLTRIEDIAAEFLREIREVQPEGPYYLVGMCMGGVVAYEMAQQLHAAGQEIGLLGLLETWSPEMVSARQLRLGGRALAVLGFVADRLRLSLETLARLRGREWLRYLLGRLKLCTEIIVRRDLFRGARGEFHLRVVTQANLLAFQQYKPRVYPGPAVLFCAEGRQVTPAADYRLAWREFTTGGLEVYSAPGEDSGLMLAEPHVQLLAAQLKTCLERAQASASPGGPGA